MYPEFDRKKLTVAPLATRCHDLTLADILPLSRVKVSLRHLTSVAQDLARAKQRQACRILMMGAHVIRAGVQRYLIDLMRQGYINCVAMNGAGVIHDFEFALIGATTESVARYIKSGQFGLWQETGHINNIVSAAMNANMGLGEAVGEHILHHDFPNKNLSILAMAHELHIPVTVHVGIGQDIVHELPNCDGAAYGATSYRDFLRFAAVLENLENGVVMNFGSAVMAPEVFLKALAMVRNCHQNHQIDNFTTLVCDLVSLPDSYQQEAAKSDPHYYFRPWKTMLVRTVADGGRGYYIQGRHETTIPQLWTALNQTGEHN